MEGVDLNRRPTGGRPPGSRNGSSDSLRSFIIEVQSGADIIQCLRDYSINRRIDISILSAQGVVENVSFRPMLNNTDYLRGLRGEMHNNTNLRGVQGVVDNVGFRQMHNNTNLRGVQGVVDNVGFRQMHHNTNLRGRFNILCMNCTFRSNLPSLTAFRHVSLLLLDPTNGFVFGGQVEGPLRALGTVTIMVAGSSNRETIPLGGPPQA